MLTTVDNPFDPFEQFTSWFMFDEEKGYHTCSYLGRIARTSDNPTSVKGGQSYYYDKNGKNCENIRSTFRRRK